MIERCRLRYNWAQHHYGDWNSGDWSSGKGKVDKEGLERGFNKQLIFLEKIRELWDEQRPSQGIEIQRVGIVNQDLVAEVMLRESAIIA